MPLVISPEIKAKYEDWKTWPKSKRKQHHQPITKADFARKYNITQQTLCNWDKPEVPESGEGFDSEKFMLDNTKAVFKSLLEACKAGNPASLRLYVDELKGILDRLTKVGNSEFGLTAEEHFSISEERNRRISELSEQTDRARDLFGQPSVLPNEVREDKG